jgi:uncharacterized protein with GYD domain
MNISEELKQEMLKHTGFDQEHIVEHYDECAIKYDEIYLGAGYYDHVKTLEVAEKLVPQEKRADY